MTGFEYPESNLAALFECIVMSLIWGTIIAVFLLGITVMVGSIVFRIEKIPNDFVLIFWISGFIVSLIVALFDLAGDRGWINR